MLFAVYDTETTGLPFHQEAGLKSQPRIIEFGGIITDGYEVLSTCEFICNPGIAIEPIITEITGLTNKDLDDKPPFEHFIPQLKGYFSQGEASIAHNAAFDRHMLQFDLQRLKLELDAIAFPQLMICTVEQTFHQYGVRKRLIDLYEEIVGPYVQKHRALDDVMCLFTIAQKLGVFEMINENEKEQA